MLDLHIILYYTYVLRVGGSLKWRRARELSDRSLRVGGDDDYDAARSLCTMMVA